MNVKNIYSIIKLKLYPFGFCHDAWELAGTTFGLMTSYILSDWMIPTVSLAFVGHLGETQFNGCTLAIAVCYIIAESILIGLNYACETLFPQYYGGNKRKMAVVLQRGVIISIYASLIICVMMLNTKHVLEWIETDPNVVAIADKFLQLYTLAVPFIAIRFLLGIYISTAGRAEKLIYANIIGNVVNVLSHLICIFYFHLDFRASPLSIALANISVVITITLYIRFSSIYEETWQPVTYACLQEWGIYLKLAIPGILVTIIECGSIQAGVFFATRLGAQSLSAQGIMQQIALLLFLTSLSVGTASSILIGKYLGANKWKEAINAKNVVYTSATVILVFSSLIVIIFHRWIPYLFNAGKHVLPLAQYGLLLIAGVNIFEGLFVVQASIIKACGMQKQTIAVSFIGFCLIALPSAYIFIFIFHLNIYGFWLGIMLGDLVIAILYFIIIWRFNWNALGQEIVGYVQLSSSASRNLEDNLSPSISINEQMQLLPYKSHQNNDIMSAANYEELGQSKDEDEISEEAKRSSNTLFTIKLIIFIICFYIFIFNCVYRFA